MAEAELEALIGRVLKKVHRIGDEAIIFSTENGKEYKLHHQQDGCESVTIESVVGDLDDLVGEPVLIAEEATSGENPAGIEIEYQESFTWTFYKFATRKGYVDIRWYGESDGFYSESVYFDEI